MRKEIYKVNFVKYDCNEYQSYNVLADSMFYNKKNNPEYEYKGKKKVNTEFTFKSNHITEKTFVDNFANTLWGVSRYNLLLVVEQEGYKLSMKLFHSYKVRRVGHQYFTTSKNVDYITINTMTGDIYYGFLHNYQKKRKFSRRLRKNSFQLDFFNIFKHQIRNLLSHFVKGLEGLNTDLIMNSAFNKFFEYIDGNNETKLTHGERLYKYYMMKRGVKFPNNFGVFLNSELKVPTLKVLRKNDMKLVESFMKIHDITGKKLRKGLHICENINLAMYKNAVNFFGEDWVNQNDDVLLKCLNFRGTLWNRPTATGREIFSPEELKRVFGMFELVLNEQLDYNTYFDHVISYVKLKTYGEEEIRWYSTSTDEFRQEHLDWTDKLQHYIQGTYYRIYPEYMMNEILKPITSDGEIYYPVLLTNSSLYNNESQLQSNCVKGYVGKVGSVIVSFRKGEEESDNRATIEYNISKEEDKVKIKNVQCLGRFNGRLTPEWDKPVEILNERMDKIVKDKRFETVKLKKVCTNGTELFSNSEWKDNRLVWEVEFIDTSHNNLYIDFNYG